MSGSASRERILDAAERRARMGGYNGFSFRDLAGDISVKSSSVHYHFPTKADLAEALARRYTERIKSRLGPPDGLDRPEAIRRLAGVFRDALVVEDRMCLCGLLGAERDALPPSVEAAVGDFFRMAIDYLASVFGTDGRDPGPVSVLARLEGALILARALRDCAVFEAAIADMR